ncbi:glycosyltransferase family 117 protein [Ornithobacterium rhinotracheale]|uniref:glycosyltransferase family 117 protein n=1 Tax=Ornithobacterium rhinotracheale TaxID=28251 RepID=UPI0040374444
MNFKKLNNLVGWLMFAIAAIVYLSSMERELSFWDCGEYIVSSSKLGVTHAPGAATFQLLGAVWSGLAFGDGNLYAILINALSALSSAFTILFLFWTITHFARRIMVKIGENKSKETKTHALSKTDIWVIMLAGVVGSLAFTFSDSFWFSAVEGEVYAMASMFTALLLWLACKWENAAGEPRENRWLVLISLLIGLSTGVHLMAILTVPAICYLYYFRHYKFTWKSFIIANVVTLAVFVFVFKVIFSYTMAFYGNLEVFMVNSLGLPFNSGTVAATIILAAVFGGALYYTKQKNWVTANTAVLSILFMLIGFTSWLVIPIRANANPHMNLNDPDDAIGLLDYYNREQYGDWPVFVGPLYTAHQDPNGVKRNPDGSYKMVDKGPIYKRNRAKGIYEVVGRRQDYVYNDDQIGWFARMYNPQSKANYEALMGPAEQTKAYDPITGKQVTHFKRPSFWQNVQFFLNYQIGYMYLRYLGWNFVGKQNDYQGNMEVTKGNTITGINFIDNILVGGSQENLPTRFKDNKARNVYFAIPLILGLIGFLFQFYKDWGRNFALISLFLLTGVGILLYTNVKPFEPRERDYAVVTSFYVFAAWIGMSVLAIYTLLKQKINPKNALLVSGLTLVAPLLMGFENWDDHTRADRRAAHDLAYNYLVNLDPNSILFVYGDNDTYPLWGLQETAMFRTDVKIANYTLLGSPWNISQAQRRTYDAMPLPSQMTEEDYRQGVNEGIIILDDDLFKQLHEYATQNSPEFLSALNQIKNYNENGMTAKEAMNWILNKENNTKNYLVEVLKQLFRGGVDNVLPTNKIIIPVDKNAVLKNKIVAPYQAEQIVPNVVVTLPNRQIGFKSELFMLDIMANYKWDRSIYFSSGGLYDPANIFYLGDYLEFEGFTYKFVPIRTPKGSNGEVGTIDANQMYNDILKYEWSNFNDTSAYFDETCRQNILTYRNAVLRTSEALVKLGENEKAKKLIALMQEKIPYTEFSDGISLYGFIPLYYRLGEDQKAKALSDFLQKQNQEEMAYYNSLPPYEKASVHSDYQRLIGEEQYATANMIDYYLTYKKDTAAAKKVFEAYYTPLENRLNKLAEKAKQVGLENMSEEDVQNLTTDLSLQRSMLGLAVEIDSTYAKKKFKEMTEMMNSIDPREN